MARLHTLELLDGDIRGKATPSILLSAETLAADTWDELVSATQTDYLERGLIVGRYTGKNTLIRSKIIKGYGQEAGEHPGEVLEAAFPIPMFPFGILKGMLLRIKEEVVIHTHPMPPDVDHVRTSVISDKDIRSFTTSRYAGLVMLDKGGAHLLTRTRPQYLDWDTPAPDIVSSTMRRVIAEAGGSTDVMTGVAEKLARYGLSYYYTPELMQTGRGVEFQNLKVAKLV